MINGIKSSDPNPIKLLLAIPNAEFSMSANADVSASLAKQQLLNLDRRFSALQRGERFGLPLGVGYRNFFKIPVEFITSVTCIVQGRN